MAKVESNPSDTNIPTNMKLYSSITSSHPAQP